MIPIVKDSIDEIIKICKRLGLQSLYLFGSASNEKKFTKNSDLDFLYKFQKDINGLTISQFDYFDLMFSLEKITGEKLIMLHKEK